MVPQLKITHVGTATAVLDINSVNFITDPFFSPAGTAFPVTDDLVLTVDSDPALRLDQLPIIDAVLLSHEDHVDNLDGPGGQLLDGRHVFTTVSGAQKLSPRPAVRGIKPWETVKVVISGKEFQITGTPTQHVKNQECTGFILTGEGFGTDGKGLPNAIYFSGDTIYIPDLKQMADKFHICAAILNLGSAHAHEDMADLTSPRYQITMDAKSAARLFREIRADFLIPMHYESWNHFSQLGDESRQVFDGEGLGDKVRWLTRGEVVSIL